MVISIPKYNERAEFSPSGSSGAKLDSARVPMNNIATDINSAIAVKNMLSDADDLRSKGVAASHYNNWKEHMGSVENELLSRKGVDASKLTDNFDSSSDDFIGKIEFGSDLERESFNNSMAVSSSATRTSLRKYELSQASELNKLQQTAVGNSAINDMVRYASNGDVNGMDSSLAIYAQSVKDKNPGITDDVLAGAVMDGISSSMYNVLLDVGKSDPVSALSTANYIRNMDGEGEGRMTELHYQSVLSTLRSGYVSDIAESNVEDVFNSPVNNYLTVGEALGEGRVDASLEDIDEVTTIKRSYKDKMSKISEELRNFSPDEDVYYEGKIKDEVSSSMKRAYESFSDNSDKARDSFLEDVSDKYINLLSEVNSFPGEDTSKSEEEMDSIEKQLGLAGEYSKLDSLKSQRRKDRITDYSKFGEALTSATLGELDHNQLTDLYTDDLSTSDLKKISGVITDKNKKTMAMNLAEANSSIDWHLKKKGKFTAESRRIRGEFSRNYYDAYAEVVEVNEGKHPSSAELSTIISTSLFRATGGKELEKGSVASEVSGRAKKMFKDRGDITYLTDNEENVMNELLNDSVRELLITRDNFSEEHVLKVFEEKMAIREFLNGI